MMWAWIFTFFFNTATFANVFGNDHRLVLSNTRLTGAYKNIVYLRGILNCSGSFVGDRLILTAAHCITGDRNANDEYPVVYPSVLYRKDAFGSQKAFHVEKIWMNAWNREKSRSNDWAILLIRESRGGSFFGYAQNSNEIQMKKQVTLAGYSADLRGNLGVHQGCSLKERAENGLIYHDCDMTHGASGAPIYRCSASDASSCKIIALNVSEFASPDGSLNLSRYSSDYANVAIPATSFASTLTTLRAKYP